MLGGPSSRIAMRGTSLNMTVAVRAGGHLVIVNLQKTPKDKKAALLIRGKADEVMRVVMSRLQIPVPAFVRQDTFLLHTAQHSGSGKGIPLEARVSSIHGPECIMPLVQSVDVSFPVSQDSSHSSCASRTVPRAASPTATSIRIAYTVP